MAARLASRCLARSLVYVRERQPRNAYAVTRSDLLPSTEKSDSGFYTWNFLAISSVAIVAIVAIVRQKQSAVTLTGRCQALRFQISNQSNETLKEIEAPRN